MIFKYWVSINLWPLLEFHTAIFGIFYFCHAVTMIEIRVTKVVWVAIFWSYLPPVASLVTPLIHLILLWHLEVELHKSGQVFWGRKSFFVSELVQRKWQLKWQPNDRNDNCCQIRPTLESNTKIETLAILLVKLTNSDCGCMTSFITILTTMATKGLSDDCACKQCKSYSLDMRCPYLLW